MKKDSWKGSNKNLMKILNVIPVSLNNPVFGSKFDHFNWMNNLLNLISFQLHIWITEW